MLAPRMVEASKILEPCLQFGFLYFDQEAIRWFHESWYVACFVPRQNRSTLVYYRPKDHIGWLFRLLNIYAILAHLGVEVIERNFDIVTGTALITLIQDGERCIGSCVHIRLILKYFARMQIAAIRLFTGVNCKTSLRKCEWTLKRVPTFQIHLQRSFLMQGFLMQSIFNLFIGYFFYVAAPKSRAQPHFIRYDASPIAFATMLLGVKRPKIMNSVHKNPKTLTADIFKMHLLVNNSNDSLIFISQALKPLHYGEWLKQRYSDIKDTFTAWEGNIE